MHQPHVDIVEIQGDAMTRGRLYASQVGDALPRFFHEDILDYFAAQGREVLLKQAARCLPSIEEHLPELRSELEGMAEVSGLSVLELCACLCHEEYYHLPQPGPGHCICFAATPLVTGHEQHYIGQTWDWMGTMCNKSFFTRWDNQAGRRILFYSYPGLMSGAGMNDAGLALVWMSGGLMSQDRKPGAGLPDYALIYGLLQHDDIASAIAWIADKPNAGWFNFSLADAHGQVAGIEGAPGIIRHYTSRFMLARQWHYWHPDVAAHCGVPLAKGNLIHPHPRESRMAQLMVQHMGRMDHGFIQAMLSDHHAACPISYGEPGGKDISVDAFYFSPREGKAWLARSPIWESAFQEVVL